MLPGLKVKIGADTSDLDRKLSDVQSKLRKFAKAAAIATAAAAAATAALWAKTSAAIDAQAKLAQTLNSPIAGLQVLERAGERAGVSMGGVEQATKDLQRRLSQAAAGTGPAVKALQALGLKAEDLMNMPVDERVALINQRIKQFIPAAQQAAAAGMLFGEEGSLLMQRIDPETIKQAALEIDKFGVALTQAQAQGIEKANDSIGSLMLSFKGTANQLTASLAPSVAELAEKLAALMVQLQPVTNMVGAVLAGAFRLLGNMIDFASENIGAITKTAAAFIALKFADMMYTTALQTIAFARSVSAAKILMRSFNSVVRKSPILLLAAALGIAADQMGLIDEAMAGLKSTFPEFFDAFGDAADGTADEITSSFNRINDALKPGALQVGTLPDFSDIIGTAASTTDKFTESLTAAQKAAKEVGDQVASSFESAMMSMVDGTKTGAEAFRDMARQIIQELFRIFVVKKITGFISAAFGGNQVSGPSLGIGNRGNFAPPPKPNFEGGGFTGYGARSGGVDGRGGMPAIVHPNETIIDHTKPNSAGIGSTIINQTINVSTGVQQTVRAEIRSLMPQIAETTKAAVADAKRRGGSYGKAFA